jgi:hypothetical protein
MAVAYGSRPVTPDNSNSNGLYSGVQTPRTPLSSGLALTEYTANPSPPTETVKQKSQSAVPEAFLLPNGFPDVRKAKSELVPRLIKPHSIFALSSPREFTK